MSEGLVSLFVMRIFLSRHSFKAGSAGSASCAQEWFFTSLPPLWKKFSAIVDVLVQAVVPRHPLGVVAHRAAIEVRADVEVELWQNPAIVVGW